MNRLQVALIAIRAIAIWFVATAIADAAGFLVLRPSFGGQRVVIGTTALTVLLQLAAAAVVWMLGPRLADRLFVEQPSGDALRASDLYRVASAFTGLLLLGQSLPAIAVLASAWGFSLSAHRSVFGSFGLDGAERAAVVNVQMKAGLVALAVRLLIGAVLVARPEAIERMILSLRREARSTDSDA
jgi:hypothetical protein